MAVLTRREVDDGVKPTLRFLSKVDWRYSFSVKWERCSFVNSTIRGSLLAYRPPPPSRTKMKDLFINLRFNYFKVFTVGVKSFFRTFQPRPKERKKVTGCRHPVGAEARGRPGTTSPCTPSRAVWERDKEVHWRGDSRLVAVWRWRYVFNKALFSTLLNFFCLFYITFFLLHITFLSTLHIFFSTFFVYFIWFFCLIYIVFYSFAFIKRGSNFVLRTLKNFWQSFCLRK